MERVLPSLIFGIIGAIICGAVASNKNRNVTGWALFGLFIPLIAIIIVACLKKKITWSDNPRFADLPCPYCQTVIDGHSTFCPKCGKQLTEEVSDQKQDNV